MLHVPGAGKRFSFCCGKTDTPGSAYFPHLEGSFPAGGEFVDPFLVRYSPWDQVPTRGSLLMREPVVPRRLVATCTLGHCLLSVFVDGVHVLALQPLLHRLIKRLDPWGVQKGFRGKTGFGPIDQGVRGPPVARLVVVTGVGVSGENILQDPPGRLIPKVLFSRGHLVVVDPFLARSATRWGAIPRRLLTPLADALRELDDLATFCGTVATVGVYRA
jgi:hypothetical protein